MVMLATIQSRTVYLLVLLLRNIKIRVYKTIILPLVLYECETWSLTLREEHRLRIFENKVLRRILVGWGGVGGLAWLRIGTSGELM
jgi:hypothetical protein